jgi:hypothetical protein
MVPAKILLIHRLMAPAKIQLIHQPMVPAKIQLIHQLMVPAMSPLIRRPMAHVMIWPIFHCQIQQSRMSRRIYRPVKIPRIAAAVITRHLATEIPLLFRNLAASSCLASLAV